MYGSEHELTNDNKGVSWEEIGKFMVKHGGESGQKAWDKIKNHKDLFKYISPSEQETDQALVQDRILNFEQFKTLNRNQKRIYIARRADQPNAFNSDMFKILDTELKNLAIRTGNGFKPSFNDLKDNPALLRSYARFIYTRSMDNFKKGKTSIVVPLPFIQYLTDEEKQQYLNNFEDNLSFKLIEKYFGKNTLIEAVNKQAKSLGFIDKEYIKYINNDELKSLYNIYEKLYSNWKKGDNYNNEEKIYNSSVMPEQEVSPVLIDLNTWKSFSNKEKEVLLSLAIKYDGKINWNEKYFTFIYSLPYIVKDKNNYYFLIPSDSNTNNSLPYPNWVMLNTNNKIIKSDISGESIIDNDGNKEILGYGFPSNEPIKRIFDIKNIKFESNKEMNETERLYENWDKYQLMVRAGLIK